MLCAAIQMKTVEQYFHVALFIMLSNEAQTFKSVGETLVCDHTIKLSCKAVLGVQLVFCHSANHRFLYELCANRTFGLLSS